MNRGYLVVSVVVIGAAVYFVGSALSKNKSQDSGVVIDGVKYENLEGELGVQAQQNQAPDMIGKITSIEGRTVTIERYSTEGEAGVGQGRGARDGQNMPSDNQNMSEQERQAIRQQRQPERETIEREVIGVETISISEQTKISTKGERGGDKKIVTTEDLKVGNQISIWITENQENQAREIIVSSI